MCRSELEFSWLRNRRAEVRVPNDSIGEFRRELQQKLPKQWLQRHLFPKDAAESTARDE